MKAPFACAFVVWQALGGSLATAQTTSADRLLDGRPPLDSFNDLSAVLEPGHDIVVVDDAGRRTRGRVSSITGDAVVVRRRARRPLLRLFGSPEDRTIPARAVTRVEIVDSTWNGGLIGAGVAPLLVYGIHRWEDAAVSDSNDMKGLGTIVFGGISAVMAIQIGRWIDLSMNESIYERRSGNAALTLTPLLAPDRTGVLARLRF